jgi:UTP--glucose-1-phosphate uridylyltransferase
MVVQEALNSGIETVILVTGRGKSLIVDHFDHAYELEDTLQKRGKTALHRDMVALAGMVRPLAVRQKQPLGLGHAILCAKDAVGREPFAILLPDDLFDAQVPPTRQLINTYMEHGLGTVALLEVPPHATAMYGVIQGRKIGDRLYRIERLVEKPPPEKAPSNLALPGRYVMPPEIFDHLENTRPGAGGEIQLTDGLDVLAAQQGMLGVITEGTRYDSGDKLGFLKANVAFALKRDDLGAELRRFLLDLLSPPSQP